MESKSFAGVQKRIDDWMDNRPRPTDEDERRDLLAMIPAIVVAGDLGTLLEVGRTLREFNRRPVAVHKNCGALRN